MGTRELIAAWEAHDQACLRWSKSRRRATVWTLQPETDALLKANSEYAEEIGISNLELSELRQRYRREHLTYSQCLAAIRQEVGNVRIDTPAWNAIDYSAATSPGTVTDTVVEVKSDPVLEERRDI